VVELLHLDGRPDPNANAVEERNSPVIAEGDRLLKKCINLKKEQQEIISTMKSILSHRGYSINKAAVGVMKISELKKELTLIPFSEREEFAHLVKPIELFQETDVRFYMPRYAGIKMFGEPENDKITKKEFQHRPNLKFKGKPRPAQLPVIEAANRGMDTVGGGIISIGCAGGKTVIAIYLACQRKRQIPTAVVCHTTGMMMQWVERIREFCPTAKIGIVQQNKCELEDKDFIIMSVKTIALKQYPAHHFDRIGLVIWDEIHLMCTNLFSKAFAKLATKHGLGLSATPFRKDKCDTVFSHHIGPVLYSKKRDADRSVEAHCISLQLDGIESVYNKFGKIMYTSMAVAITKRDDRTEYLANLIGGLGSQGRCVLVLSEYINHLKSIKKAIEECYFYRSCPQQQYAFMSAWHSQSDSPLKVLPKDIGKIIASHIVRPVTCGLYIGEMKNKDRKISEGKDILLGSYKMASVGMDIPTLNSLVFASPRKDIEQSVGRILRAKHAAFNPIIYDIIDNHGVFKAQSKARKDFYRQYEYTIVHTQQLANGTVLSSRKVKAKKSKEDDEDNETPGDCMFLE
jgi:superfamily II DNA or RNA helicase